MAGRMRQHLTDLAVRAAERWQEHRRLLEAWILLIAGLLAADVILAVATGSLAAIVSAAAFCALTAGFAAVLLVTFAIARLRGPGNKREDRDG
jgi:hypothetical protein